MPTNFIALQCFQCSTMQVKQQKKSSNKWRCVVCNHNQSVRNVFAQGAMARDVRTFVQSFNMSRQLADQKRSLSDEIETFDPREDERKARRNDWSEYVDDQDENCGKFDQDGGDNGLEPMVVTEMPKAVFKKPKMKDYSSNGYGSGKMFKPVFADRRNAKSRRNEHSQDIHLTEFEKMKSDCSDEKPMSLHPSDHAPRWNRFRSQIQDSNTNESFVWQPAKEVKGSVSKWSDYNKTEESENNVAVRAPAVQLRRTTAAKGPVSKWSSFITEEEEEDEDDNLESVRGRDSWNRVSERAIYPFETTMNDERVDDDIHPDFL